MLYTTLVVPYNDNEIPGIVLGFPRWVIPEMLLFAHKHTSL